MVAREVAHDRLCSPKDLDDLGQLGDDLAAGLAGGDVQLTRPSASRRAARCARSALQPRDAALRARAARLHALADPDLFLRQQLVGLGVDHRLLRQLLFLERLVLA